ncbi:hypothetical protein ACQV5M_03005 [Leptospira sp. SA-E8]|uniref:hypothetical protein n=1 Tax=Leptospira sp. SA-E8 TaxID=3422259 RepID=UPI003EBFF2A4
MHVVLLFRKKIFGYGFECEEDKFAYESDRIRDRLDQHVLKNHIRKKSLVAKYESFGRIFKGFIGFLEEDVSFFSGDLEEVEIETGKYLKFRNLSGADELETQLDIDKKVRTYLEENNIRTDWMRFSSRKNSYLRIIN